MILINFAGLILIALIVWWFWLYKNQPQVFTDELVIRVADGVYQPDTLTLKAHQPHTVTFLRKDKSPCAETVVFPELELSETLAVDQLVRIQLPALTPGVYAFHCQMQMYKGKLSVEEDRNDTSGN